MDMYTGRQRYPNNGTRRYQNNSMNFITNNIRNIVQKKISLEIIVILIIVCFIFFVYSFSSIVYYWYFYTYTECNMGVYYDIPETDASKDKMNAINFTTTDGRNVENKILTDDKNVKFIYYNNIQPKEFLIRKNHPALDLIPIILLCVSSFVLFMILFGTFHEWGIFFYVILLTTNTICVFSYLTYIMTRFRKASKWTYQIKNADNTFTDTTSDKITDVDLKNSNVYYSFNTTKDENVKTQVSVNKYDTNNYILYYDTTDIQNFIILSKTSFPPYFMPLLITCLLFFGLIMMCTMFLFLQ